MAELPKFEVTENCLYRPVNKHGLVIEADMVLTREEFVACYNKWIKDPYDEEYDRMKRSILDKYGIQDESLEGEYGNKPLPVSSYEEICKSIPDSGVEAFEKSVKDAIEFRTKMEKTN